MFLFQFIVQLRVFIIMRLFLIVILTVTFLIVSINLFVTLVMFIAEDYHMVDHVTIYEIFQSKQYQHIRDRLMNKNYTILIGDDETGVKNFIEHQANIHTLEGHPVVVKQYQSSSKEKQKLLKTIKQTKFYMEMALGLDREERTQVFFVKNMDDLPLQEISFIREKYPSDNIIIICQKPLPIKLKGFAKIEFPQVSISQLKEAMQKYYGLKPKQIKKIIEQSYGSVEKIFKYFKRRSTLEIETAEEIVQVDDIEDLNEISHELAEKERRRMARKMMKKKNEKKKSQ